MRSEAIEKRREKITYENFKDKAIEDELTRHSYKFIPASITPDDQF
jgi:hypothetical protein